jgi:hypothetical protein
MGDAQRCKARCARAPAPAAPDGVPVAGSNDVFGAESTNSDYWKQYRGDFCFCPSQIRDLIYVCSQVTPAIRDYVNDKIGSALSKVGRRVSKCDVHIIFDKNPSVANPAHAEVMLKSFRSNQTIWGSFDGTVQKRTPFR